MAQKLATTSKALLLICALALPTGFARADDNDSLADAGATTVAVPAPEAKVDTPVQAASTPPPEVAPVVQAVAQAEIVPTAYLRAKARWNAWVSARGVACDPQFDTIAKFNPTSNRVALVLHGMGSNPRGMREVIDLLYNQGFTVLAPRLTGHFNQNIYDLDEATADDWSRDAEESFRLAKGFGKRITVVGYSLGGTLASRLMIEYPNQIENGILFAPAWRVTPTVSLGSALGTLLHVSLNDYNHVPSACSVAAAYIPGNAGHEVENLIIDTEQSLGSVYSTTKPTTSIFARMRVPQIVFTSPRDEAIDRDAVSSICGWNHGYCTEISAGGNGHAGIPSHLDRSCRGVNDNSPVRKPTRGNPGETVSGDISKFINLAQ